MYRTGDYKGFENWPLFDVHVKIRAPNAEKAKQLVEHSFDIYMSYEDKAIHMPKVTSVKRR